MKKSIYTAAITAFAASILSSAYAGDNGEEKENIGTRVAVIRVSTLKTLGDAMGEIALKNFEKQQERRNAEKEQLAIEIRKDKERSGSLTDDLVNAVQEKSLLSILPPDAVLTMTIMFPTGVMGKVTYDKDGNPIVSQDSPVMSPVKSRGKALIEKDSKLIEVHLGH